MRLISRKAFDDAADEHADPRLLDEGRKIYRTFKSERITNFSKLKDIFGHKADWVRGQLVLNVLNNDYRMIANIQYWDLTEPKLTERRSTKGCEKTLGEGVLYVKHILTHKQYDRWNREMGK